MSVVDQRYSNNTQDSLNMLLFHPVCGRGLLMGTTCGQIHCLVPHFYAEQTPPPSSSPPSSSSSSSISNTSTPPPTNNPNNTNRTSSAHRIRVRWSQ